MKYRHRETQRCVGREHLTIRTGCYQNDGNSKWNGDLFAGSLCQEQLHQLEIENDEVVHEEILLTDTIGRIRDVRMRSDGYLYLLTDESNDGLYRIEPN